MSGHVSGILLIANIAGREATGSSCPGSLRKRRAHDGQAAPNPLTPLSRWKIFDNLRRSLFEISVLLLLVAGWITLEHPVRWTLAVLASAPRAGLRGYAAQLSSARRSAALAVVFPPFRRANFARAIATRC